jgi:ribosomal protein S12 methylthiotransferase accessory factor
MERDAFLMAWYSRGRLREWVLEPGDDRTSLDIKARIEARGFDLHVFDVSNDFGVPVAWSLAVNREDRYPKTLMAAGAHFDPQRAVRGALLELGVFVHEHTQKYTDEDLEGMLGNPYRVNYLEHHVALNAYPPAFDRFEFALRPDRERVPLARAFSDWRERFVRPDLGQCLEDMLARVHALGLEVIVVDQTSPALQELGLHSVKVIVPGALPMTFGYDTTRVTGIPRLLHVPRQLGRVDRDQRLEDLELYPHPFP